MDTRRVMSQKSGNVDESGNFSVQVIKAALRQSHQISIECLASVKEPIDRQIGFVIHRSDHWLSVRKIGKNWWNLNSTLERPELISGFYLDAFITQLQKDGFMVFVVQGELPPAWSGQSDIPGSGQWFAESILLGQWNASRAGEDANAGSSTNGGGIVHRNTMNNTAAAADYFQGSSHRVGGARASITATNTHTPQTEEEEIALAIQLSLESNTGCKDNTPALSEKEKMRNKRLAMLDRK